MAEEVDSGTLSHTWYDRGMAAAEGSVAQSPTESPGSPLRSRKFRGWQWLSGLAVAQATTSDVDCVTEPRQSGPDRQHSYLSCSAPVNYLVLYSPRSTVAAALAGANLHLLRLSHCGIRTRRGRTHIEPGQTVAAAALAGAMVRHPQAVVPDSEGRQQCELPRPSLV